MMKKNILLLFSLVITGLVFMSGQTYAQVCTPDPQYTIPGIHPDSIIGLQDATVGCPYDQIITVIVAPDTTHPDCDALSGIIVIDSVVLTGIANTPPGLQYECNPPSCSWAGGTDGCISVYGTPTNTGSYNIVAYTTAYVYCDWFFGPTYAEEDDSIDYYVINVSPALSAATTSTDVSCNGGFDGSATATATGGATPYTYQWDDPGSQTTQTATGLLAGTYNVTVTDNNDCPAVDAVTINEPAAITISSEVSTNITCNGLFDGTITITANGGTGTLSYSIDGGSTYPNTTGNFSGLSAGSYNVIVRDANLCTQTGSTITLSEPSAIILATASVNATCGNSDGEASVSIVSGGVAPFTYLWDDPASQTTYTATGLAAGAYTIIVVDFTGCTEDTIVSVNDAGAPTATITSVVNVSCNSGSDGSATVSVSGGAPPYTYNWSGGGTGTNLSQGSYSVTVTDNVGCVAVANFTITEPPAITISSESSTDITCYGLTNGTIMITANGGTGTLEYSIDGGITYPNTTGNFSSLSAGSYDVMVRDGNLCTQAGSTLNINDPSAITGSPSSTDDSGTCDGDASISASGGTGAYTYQWDDPASQTTQTATALCADSYTVTVTDANGCTYSTSVTVNTGGSPLSATANATDVTCYGACNGTATVNATGGTPPYTYLWDDNLAQTTAIATGLCADSYSVTVTDANSGNVNATATIIEPTDFFVTLSSTDETISGGNDGTTSVLVYGSTPPYTYLWSPGGQTTDDISGLTPDLYTVTVTDANGCTYVGSVAVNSFECSSSNLSATVSGTNETSIGASDGTATVTASGGTTPYTYLWSTGGTTTTIDNLASGTYSVTVSDNSGCIAGGSVTISVGTGLNKVSYHNLIKVYPNPAINIINFEISDYRSSHIIIFNILGNQLKSITVDNTITQVNTAELSEGLYIYQIFDNKAMPLKNGKFNVSR
ncbi:MAG: T9SS type A sorting domain-containing protein [Bacteroidota bacterium]